MIINKVTVGFVVQQFDTETRKFTNQQFIASEDSTWEDPETGNELESCFDNALELIYGKGGVDEPELPLNMVQP